MPRITPYTRSNYPTIEGNERVYFEDEFRKIQQTLRQIINSLNTSTQFPTIASGVITLESVDNPIIMLQIDTEGAAATDDLDTISGGRFGQVLVLKPADGSRTVVVKDGTGNLNTAGDHSMDNSQDTITLMRTSESNDVWREIARSNNAA